MKVMKANLVNKNDKNRYPIDQIIWVVNSLEEIFKGLIEKNFSDLRKT